MGDDMEQQKRVLSCEATTKRISEYIKQNGLKAGDRLPPERQLASLFSVSRSNIRETLITLEAKNLLTIKHGSGIYINTVDEFQWALYEPFQYAHTKHDVFQTLKEMIELRVLIEVHCFCAIAEFLTEQQASVIREYNEQQYMGLISNRKQMAPGLDFEEKIIELMPNRIIISTYRQMNINWKNYLSAINYVALAPYERYMDHLDILDAIINKNKNKIVAATNKHHLKTLKNLELMLKLQEKERRSQDQ